MSNEEFLSDMDLVYLLDNCSDKSRTECPHDLTISQLSLSHECVLRETYKALKIGNTDKIRRFFYYLQYNWCDAPILYAYLIIRKLLNDNGVKSIKYKDFIHSLGVANLNAGNLGDYMGNYFIPKWTDHLRDDPVSKLNLDKLLEYCDDPYTN